MTVACFCLHEIEHSIQACNFACDSVKARRTADKFKGMQWAALWARSGTRALPHEAVEALLILLSIICESSRHSVTVYAPA